MFARLTRLTRVPLAQEGMGSGDTHTSASPVGNGVRRSPVSPTGSTRGTFKSPASISKLIYMLSIINLDYVGLNICRYFHGRNNFFLRWF